jgi:site-specific recombinase XerD
MDTERPATTVDLVPPVTDLVPVAYIPPPSLAVLTARAATYAKTAKAANTTKAYAADLRTFETWCGWNVMPYLPTSTDVLACYVAWLADQGKKASTISRAVSAIIGAHRAGGHDLPKGRVLEDTLLGIRRTIGTAPVQKAPVLAADLKKMVESCGPRGFAKPGEYAPGELLAIRDRALLVLGWVGALRRSEIVALTVADVVKVRTGLEVTIRRSKTDQEGVGRVVGLSRSSDTAFCPVALLDAWLTASGIVSGPLFRAVNCHGHYSLKGLSTVSVAKIVKGRAKDVGLEYEKISGHSLRAGFMTEASQQGKSLRSMMNQTGHSSTRTALKYIRQTEVWSENASKGLL